MVAGFGWGGGEFLGQIDNLSVKALHNLLNDEAVQVKKDMERNG